ncbi:MAG: prepilin-type N-terminal cleavage/methylation domain-containing protein [Bacilli bacterium]
MKKKGFTLVELLAVIVILAIILAIAVPSITKLIENQRKSAFESSIKLIIKNLEVKILGDEEFDVTEIDEDKLGGLDVNPDDYNEFSAQLNEDNVLTVTATGAGKFDGWKVENATSSEVNATKVEG